MTRCRLSCTEAPLAHLATFASCPAVFAQFFSEVDVDVSCPETVERENNKDYNQVLLDVQRSLRRFPPGE